MFVTFDAISGRVDLRLVFGKIAPPPRPGLPPYPRMLVSLMNHETLSRARESRAAIERLYIEMRHLYNHGRYRHLGAPGEVLTDALLTLSPEIYGSVGDSNKVELEGLVYVIDRQPKGIESCRFIKLISEEGFAESGFAVLMPAARRRNCYRIDEDHMFIEVTRGRSEIYDILTHLTFLFMESRKIIHHVLDEEGPVSVEWERLEAIAKGEVTIDRDNEEVALTFLATILGRSFAETKQAYERLAGRPERNSGLFNVVYHLGRLAMHEKLHDQPREITVSPTLRDRLGHHIYGERWADNIKTFLAERDLLQRPIHIISANLHSVMNCLYAPAALQQHYGPKASIEQIALDLSQPEHQQRRQQVLDYAHRHGMHSLDDPSGTNISVQIFDAAKLDLRHLSPELRFDRDHITQQQPVIIVMDYAFGEQAYETMDELLKTYQPQKPGPKTYMPVESISIMGKAGILDGGKGDIMVPTAHIFEGTADNYPFHNDLCADDFEAEGIPVCAGPMITVLGTSLQNRDVLAYFKESSWGAIGLEMEGAHYQKAIQAASQIRKTIRPDVVLRYAYYASDNPLETGSTLASGSLGAVGVRPTYLITRQLLGRILQPVRETASLTQSGTEGGPNGH